MSDRKMRRLSILCVLSLIGLPFVVFWPVTIGRQVWAVGDFAAYHHPLFVVAAAQWRRGHLPLWNPYMFGGTPLVAAQQVGVFYPLNVALWLIFPAWRMLGLSVLIHLALTGLSTWLFLRSLRLHPVASWLGGIVFAWGGFTMSHLGHIGILRALPWIGLALYGFNRWLESRQPRYLLTMSVSLALLCLSGYVQIILYGLLLVLTYFLFAVRAPVLRKIQAWAASGLGISLSALQLLPGIELWVRKEYLRPGEGNFIALTGYSFHPAYLLTLIFPRSRAGTFAEMVGYVGVIPLVLILLSFLMHKEHNMNRVYRFFASWMVLSLLLSLGRYFPPLAVLIFFTPVFGSLGIPSKHLLEFTFSSAVLAAIGLDMWINDAKIGQPTGKYLWLGSILGLAWVCWALVAPYASDVPPVHFVWADMRIVGQPVTLLLLGTSLLLTGRRFRRSVRHVSVFLLAAITLWDLLDFGLPIYQSGLTSPRFYEIPPPTARWLQEYNTCSDPYRILSFEATGHLLEREIGKNLLAANYNAAYGIESLIGHDGLMLRRLNSQGKIPPWGYVAPEAVEEVSFRALLDQMNVKYLLVSSGRANSLAKYYSRISLLDGVEIYHNDTARARLFVLIPLANQGLDSSEDRMVFTDPSGNLWIDPPLTEDFYIRILGYYGDRVEAEVLLAQKGMVIHSANWVTGWRARVDGKTTPIIPVNGFLQGVQVAEGYHHVVFEYAPISFKIGVGISGFAFCMLIVLYAISSASKSHLEA